MVDTHRGDPVVIGRTVDPHGRFGTGPLHLRHILETFEKTRLDDLVTDIIEVIKRVGEEFGVAWSIAYSVHIKKVKKSTQPLAK